MQDVLLISDIGPMNHSTRAALSSILAAYVRGADIGRCVAACSAAPPGEEAAEEFSRTVIWMAEPLELARSGAVGRVLRLAGTELQVGPAEGLVSAAQATEKGGGSEHSGEYGGDDKSLRAANLAKRQQPALAEASATDELESGIEQF